MDAGEWFVPLIIRGDPNDRRIAQFLIVRDDESPSGVSLEVEHRQDITRDVLLEMLDSIRECIADNPWVPTGEDGT